MIFLKKINSTAILAFKDTKALIIYQVEILNID